MNSKNYQHGKCRRFLTATVLFALIGAVGGGVFYAGPLHGQATPPGQSSGKSIKFVSTPIYKEECGSCHLAFLPGFLPKRSWEKMMATLDDHFGENASLDDDPRQEITTFLVGNAADAKTSTPRSKRIAKMVAESESPLRITETVFWQRKHYSIKRYVWKREKIGTKAKCEACHRDADKGQYSEFDVNVPR